MSEARHPEPGKRRAEGAAPKDRARKKEISKDLRGYTFPHLKPGQKKTVKEAGEMKRAAAIEDSAVLARAIEVIGNQSDAMRWMGTPVRDLGYATPISLLYDRKGCRAVESVLDKLEYGVL